MSENLLKDQLDDNTLEELNKIKENDSSKIEPIKEQAAEKVNLIRDSLNQKTQSLQSKVKNKELTEEDIKKLILVATIAFKIATLLLKYKKRK